MFCLVVGVDFFRGNGELCFVRHDDNVELLDIDRNFFGADSNKAGVSNKGSRVAG